MKRALALSLAVLSSPAAAEGWHATEREKSSAQNNVPVTLELYYQAGKLRIDQGPDMSSIFDLGTGRLTVLNHKQKSFVTDTFEELAKIRDAMIANTKKQLASFPPELRKDLETKIKALDRKSVELPAPTGKKSTVGPYSCQEYRTTSAITETTICVVQDVGVPMADFNRRAKAMTDRLHKLKMGGAEGPGGVALFEAARFGFPVRSLSRVTVGGQRFDTETELVAIKAEDIPPERFEVPKNYTVSRPPDLAPPPMPREK
ncbi:MAG: DUF4412 domain-containing protein [Myxococcota bacterium]